MNKKIKIKITATVEAIVEMEEGETVEDFKYRNVDIYLHGAGNLGHINKTDLGGNATIEILE